MAACSDRQHCIQYANRDLHLVLVDSANRVLVDDQLLILDSDTKFASIRSISATGSLAETVERASLVELHMQKLSNKRKPEAVASCC